MSKLAELEAQIAQLSKENERLVQQQRYNDEKNAKEIKWLRAELAKGRQGDEKISFAKLSFLADMSHELRTPLNAVIGFCQYLLGDKSLNKDQEEKIRLMLASSEELVSLINDILEMSKVEIGEMNLQRSNFDLYEMLESLSSNFHSRAYAKGINFETDFVDDLPRFLFGDGDKLRYILVNMLSNGIKTRANEKLIFRAWRGEEINQDTYHLFFEIESISPAIAPALNLDTSTLTPASLGLTISREFARKMQGDLAHKSQNGHASSLMVGVQIEIASTMPEKPDSFLERVSRVSDIRDRFRHIEARLTLLPPDTHGELYIALNQYSLSSVERVCHKIAKTDASLAQEIVGLAKEFDFKTILNLLSK